MNIDPTVWEHINGVQQYVREHLEERFEGYRVYVLTADIKSRYAHPMHSFVKDPDLVLKSGHAVFHAFLEKAGDYSKRMRVMALLGEDGRVEASVINHFQEDRPQI